MGRGKSHQYYTYGPDERDNRAEIRYDPTYGVSSTGDIILELGMNPSS